jgi:hypothetical protein
VSLHFDIERAMNEVRLLFDANPELMEGGTLTEDMVEGSTSLHDLMDKLLGAIRETNTLNTALEGEISFLEKRHQRFSERVGKLRETIFKLMQLANLKKLERPTGTLSIANGRPKVIITDESLLPKDCIRIKEEPNKEMIRLRLEHGGNVSGATLSNAEPRLVIR